MSNFEDWARATYRQMGIEVGENELVLIEMIYAGALGQLEMLDRINLEEFPARGIDLRHAPKAT
ncbi:MAG: hypothetical protein ABSG09_03910 [Acidimicrobiales bacterium]|jgi:hypothetical protein